MFSEDFFTVMVCIAFVLTVICVGSVLVVIFQKSKLRYDEETGIATVCGKVYVKEFYIPFVIPFGHMMPTRVYYHEAEYKVQLMYEGKKYCINDKLLYEEVEMNDTIPVLVHKSCNTKGKPIIYLTKE